MAREPKLGPNIGNAGKGRPKGAPNRTTALLKDAIILAAEQTGRDQQGKDGLVGYCRFLAVEEPKAFATLMGRVLPMQIEGGENPVRIASEVRLIGVRAG